mgnify:CR=1 FL=1
MLNFQRPHVMCWITVKIDPLDDGFLKISLIIIYFLMSNSKASQRRLVRFEVDKLNDAVSQKVKFV